MPQLILTAPLVSNVIEVGSNGFQSLGVPLFSWRADGVQLKMFPPRLASQLTMNKLLSSTLIKVKCLGSPLFHFFFFFFFAILKVPTCWRGAACLGLTVLTII